jgi:hypothetical protein
VSPQIWNKVDFDETGWLDKNGVGEVLAMLGEEISDKKLTKVIDEIGADAHGRVAARDFVRETSQKSPTQVAVLQQSRWLFSAVLTFGYSCAEAAILLAGAVYRDGDLLRADARAGPQGRGLLRAARCAQPRP